MARSFLLLWTSLVLVSGFQSYFCADHQRSKRWLVYQPGSFMQFAVALVLPAEVRGRAINTNTGILLNIDLPTNATIYTNPPVGSLARYHQSSFIDMVQDSLKLELRKKVKMKMNNNDWAGLCLQSANSCRLSFLDAMDPEASQVVQKHFQKQVR